MNNNIKKMTRAFSPRHLQSVFGTLDEVRSSDSDHGQEVRVSGAKKSLLIRKDRKGFVTIKGDSKIGISLAKDILFVLK